MTSGSAMVEQLESRSWVLFGPLGAEYLYLSPSQVLRAVESAATIDSVEVGDDLDVSGAKVEPIGPKPEPGEWTEDLEKLAARLDEGYAEMSVDEFRRFASFSDAVNAAHFIFKCRSKENETHSGTLHAQAYDSTVWRLFGPTWLVDKVAIECLLIDSRVMMMFDPRKEARVDV